MKIQFCGAAQHVTGSKHLITTTSGSNILLDCGLFQGINTSELNLNFGFEPKDIDVLLLSHAHIDHSGLIPRLVRLGFKGVIYATPATFALCEIMLLDSAHIQEKDLERINERRIKRGETPYELLYNMEDVSMALELFQPVAYKTPFYVAEGLKAEFYDMGHILGSAGVFLTYQEGNKSKKIFFTGDIGRPYDKILHSPEVFPQADVIICESTYGNKLHETEPDLKSHLLRIVQQTCVENHGKLIIPAFAVDRTQELIYALDQLASEGRLPRLKVFIDSPLAVKATQVMDDHQECFNPELLAYIKKDGNAFDFPNLFYVSDIEQSKKINDLTEPCIIISASGMAEAGRIKHHIANNIENPRNTVLLVGYCSANSLGGALKNGEKSVRIFGKEFTVKANIAVMDSFSAHADYEEMIAYLGCQNASKVEKLFLVHGEIENQIPFKNRLEAVGFANVFIPKMFEVHEV